MKLRQEPSDLKRLQKNNKKLKREIRILKTLLKDSKNENDRLYQYIQELESYVEFQESCSSYSAY